MAGSTCAQEAADPSAVNADSLSASTRQQLIALNATPPLEPALCKRTADSAELPDRTTQASKDSHDSHMAE